MSSLARRHVLTSLAGLPLAAVLADPRLAAAAAAGLETRFYTPAFHQAAFVLPRPIAALLG